MNYDLCNHLLLGNSNIENEPAAGSDAPAPLRREFQQALRNTLLCDMGGGSGKSERSAGSGASSGGGGAVSPRVLSFTERPPTPEDRYSNVLKVITECRIRCMLELFFQSMCGRGGEREGA